MSSILRWRQPHTFHFGEPVRVKSWGYMCCICHRCTDEFKPGKGEDEAIKVANEAVKILYEWDEKKRLKGKRWLYPSLL